MRSINHALAFLQARTILSLIALVVVTGMIHESAPLVAVLVVPVPVESFT